MREAAAIVLRKAAENIMDLTESEAAHLSKMVQSFFISAAAVKEQSVSKAIAKVKPGKAGRPKQSAVTFSELLTAEAPPGLEEAVRKIFEYYTLDSGLFAGIGWALIKKGYIPQNVGVKTLYLTLMELTPESWRQKCGSYGTFFAYLRPVTEKPCSRSKPNPYDDSRQKFINMINEALQ